MAKMPVISKIRFANYWLNKENRIFVELKNVCANATPYLKETF